MPDDTLGAEDSNGLCRHAIAERIREKIVDYGRYGFSLVQANAFNVFFDLAQEYEDIQNLYQLPVEVLRLFFNLPAALYVREAGDCFCLRTPPLAGLPALPPLADLHGAVAQAGGCYFFPARGRPRGAADDSRSRTDSGDGILETPDDRKVLAVLAVLPETALRKDEILYFEKFANRLGFCLHNRILAEKNKEHIRFVRGLVHDIGHNVIVPNMYFKLLIRQMEGKIKNLGEMCEHLSSQPDTVAVQSLSRLHQRMVEQYQEITRHFQQSSFFLETLLRQSHFDQGQYVLHKATLDLAARIVRVQTERYRARLAERGIRLEESFPEAGEAPVLVRGDAGLLSQVAANYLSNAVKYTRKTPDSPARVRCVVRRVPDRYGKGADAAWFGMYTTGRPIPAEDACNLFTENFRASNTEDEYGTGHGLHFIRLIMEQHGGEAGYAWEDGCNLFYFVLPCAEGE